VRCEHEAKILVQVRARFQVSEEEDDAQARWKLKHHAAEAGGVEERRAAQARWKLKHHAAEAGGVEERRCGLD